MRLDPALHLHHVLGTYRELARNRVDLGARERAGVLLRSAQVEEELALGAGGRDLDDAPVAQPARACQRKVTEPPAAVAAGAGPGTAAGVAVTTVDRTPAPASGPPMGHTAQQALADDAVERRGAGAPPPADPEAGIR